MRITSKIMQNNSLSNINTNKKTQDRLNTQMATEKKINRPSEDPVVAIRALRLRTNVSQITQYYEKNSKDAESWLSVTEDALTNVSTVIEDMIAQAEKGANENLKSEDRTAILDALKSLRDEVYATGNADYAGRSIFTGYRTETTLKFIEDTTKRYSITEDLTTADIDQITHVVTGNLNSINDANYNDADHNGIIEQQVETQSIYRIRLGYTDVDGVDGGVTDSNGNVVRAAIPAIRYYDPTVDNGDGTFGNYVELTQVDSGVDNDGDGVNETAAFGGIQVVSIDDNPYENVPADGAVMIQETGEILLGENVYRTLMAQKDDVNTPFDESSILVTYEKSNWEKDDLKPEHYFKCEDMTDSDNLIVYNENYIVPGEVVEKQVIEYDIGMNQTIRVNTTADEVFVHAIGRDVDDLITAMQNVLDMEETIRRLETMAADPQYNDQQRETINNQLDAANKALTYLDETAQKMFEHGMTKMQNHLDTANLATTNCGTRGKKLELVQNRLMSQKSNFENLESENENVDVTEVAIKLTSAELTYEAALMATSKIMQTSLMHYI